MRFSLSNDVDKIRRRIERFGGRQAEGIEQHAIDFLQTRIEDVNTVRCEEAHGCSRPEVDDRERGCRSSTTNEVYMDVVALKMDNVGNAGRIFGVVSGNVRGGLLYE